MELIDKDLISYLIENQKKSQEQATSVLKERCPSVLCLSSQSVRRFSSKRSISSRVSTENVTEMVIEASSKIMFSF